MPSKSTTPPPSHARVLVVDDEKNIRLLVRTVLETDGYVVDEAADGAAALELIRSAAFDLVLLDLNMPIVDGMTLLEQLESNPPRHRPRVAVLTAYGSVTLAVRATRHGALDFLEKPITPDQLRTVVAAVLAEPEPAGIGAEEPHGFAGVLDRVRSALRCSDVAKAETLLLRAADIGQNVAAYYNLLGVLYEIRSQQRLARKMYTKAFSADADHGPAEQNLRRLYELQTFGRTTIPVALGDALDLDPAAPNRRSALH